MNTIETNTTSSPGPGRPLRVREVAARIGASQATVRNLIRDRRLRAVQHGGKTSPWIVYEADLEQYIRTEQENTR